MDNSDNRQVRTIKGRVISDKGDKTVIVLVERKVKHSLYGKIMKRSTRFHVHDENNECIEGNIVSIEECRPVSKTKFFKVVKIF